MHVLEQAIAAIESADSNEDIQAKLALRLSALSRIRSHTLRMWSTLNDAASWLIALLLMLVRGLAWPCRCWCWRCR